MKQEGSIIILILIGSFVLASIIGILYLSKSALLKSPSVSIQTTPAPIPTTSSALNEMAKWTTYTSTKYGFEFKYPSNLDYECCGLAGPLSPRNLESVITLADPATATQETDKPFDGFALYIFSNSSKIPFRNYLDEEKTSTLLEGYGCSGQKDWKEEQIIINGKSVNTLKDVCSVNITYIPLMDDKILITVQSNASAGSFDSDFNQILSTFKFTN